MPEWLKKLLESLKGKNIDSLTDAEKSELAKFAPEMQTTGVQNPASPTVQVDNGDTVKAMQQKMELMYAMLDKADKEREAMQKQIEEQAKKDLSAKIDAKIEEAKKLGKVAAKDETAVAKLKALYEKDFESTDYMIQKMDAKINQGEQNSNGQNPNIQQQTGGAVKTRAELINAAKESFKTKG